MRIRNTMSTNAKRSRKNAMVTAVDATAPPQLGWDDLELVLALARAGSLAGAGARLGVNTSTVGRRLDALEGSLGVHLFDRSPTGMAVTELAESLVPIAETIERSVADALRLVEHRETDPEGSVRITAPPGIANWFIAPRLVRLRERYPKLTVELDAAIGYADLTRREADLALRATRPRSGDLVSVRLAEAASVIVAARAVVERVGPVDRLDALDWITWGPDLAGLPEARWITANVDAHAIVLRTSSMDAQIQAVQAGLGAMLIGQPFADWIGLAEVPITSGLARRLPTRPTGSLWLVGHRALRDVPRVRAVWEFLVEEARSFTD